MSDNSSQRSYWYVAVLCLHTIYCTYIWSRYTREEYEYDDIQPDTVDASCLNASECITPRSPLDLPLLRRSHIDAEYTDETVFPKVINGVRMGEGDGTVNLLSLGAMCVEGWKRKRWNPSGIKVVTVEVSISMCEIHLLKFAVSCRTILCRQSREEAEPQATTWTSLVRPH